MVWNRRLPAASHSLSPRARMETYEYPAPVTREATELTELTDGTPDGFLTQQKVLVHPTAARFGISQPPEQNGQATRLPTLQQSAPRVALPLPHSLQQPLPLQPEQWQLP